MVESLLFVHHPMPMWLQAPGHGAILAVNQAAERHYGIPHRPFLSLRHADLLVDAAKADASGTACPSDGAIVCHRVADGRHALMRLWVSRLPMQGETACLVMAQDVTVSSRESRLLRETAVELNRVQELEWQGWRAAEQAHAELQALSRGLIGLQERERRGIARELHDEIGQSLSAIRVQFAKLRRRVEGTELLGLIDAAGALTEQTLGRVRNLSLMLHPPQLETLGLEAALRWHVGQVEKLHGLAVVLDVGPLDRPMDPDLAIAVYRIVQEALNNVVRHARAGQASVAISSDARQLRVDIADDGVGFLLSQVRLKWEESPSMGLIGMQERARLLGGELSVRSQPGQGTRIAASLPWR